MDDLHRKTKVAKATDYVVKFSTLYKRLKTQESILDNATDSALHNLKCEDTLNFIASVEVAKKQDLEKITEEYIMLKNCLENLTDNVISIERLENHDIEFYKQNVNHLEDKINQFNVNIKKQREDLQKAEQELSNEVNVLEKLLAEDELFCSINRNLIKPSSVRIIKNMPHTEDKDVQRFQSFLLRTGGHTGGWGDVEHTVFMQCWQKCYPKNSVDTNIDDDKFHLKIVDEVQKKLPEISSEEIVAHCNWLSEYKNLKELQAKAIEIWKALREAHKYHKEIIEDVKLNENNEKSKENNSGKQNVRLLLEEWKKNKECEKKTQQDKQVGETFNQNKIQFSKERNHKNDKDLIKKWTETKRLELEERLLREQEISKKDKELKAIEANKKIKEFRKKDLSFMLERKSLIENKRHNSEPIRISNKNSKINREGRFNDTTEQWRQRISRHRSMDSINLNFGMNGVENVPKLGTPEWRKGIMSR